MQQLPGKLCSRQLACNSCLTGYAMANLQAVHTDHESSPDSSHVGLGSRINVAVPIGVEPAPVHSILKGALVTEFQQQPSLKQLLVFGLLSAV